MILKRKMIKNHIFVGLKKIQMLVYQSLMMMMKIENYNMMMMVIFVFSLTLKFNNRFSCRLRKFNCSRKIKSRRRLNKNNMIEDLYRFSILIHFHLLIIQQLNINHLIKAFMLNMEILKI